MPADSLATYMTRTKSYYAQVYSTFYTYTYCAQAGTVHGLSQCRPRRALMRDNKNDTTDGEAIASNVICLLTRRPAPPCAAN